jgi:hypothetical protein
MFWLPWIATIDLGSPRSPEQFKAAERRLRHQTASYGNVSLPPQLFLGNLRVRTVRTSMTSIKGIDQRWTILRPALHHNLPFLLLRRPARPIFSLRLQYYFITFFNIKPHHHNIYQHAFLYQLPPRCSRVRYSPGQRRTRSGHQEDRCSR